MRGTSILLALLPALAATAAQVDPETHHRLLRSGRPYIGLWQQHLKQARAAEQLASFSNNVGHLQTPLKSDPTHDAHCFYQPLSHFDPAYNETFCQRYWIDASNYKPGGPVYLLDGGETSGANRIPFLDTGILEILSNATGGLSIVLEHRYYGKSVPVESLSTDNLRFLNNDESAEDSANFIRTFVPPPEILTLEDNEALKPYNTPWIYYGGSYAGARAAHMRVLYPDIVFGAIASSAVTHAQVVFPQYFDPIQEYGPKDCISALQSAIIAMDALLELPEPVPSHIKGIFGLEGLTHADFGDTIQFPLGGWQGQNWDPKISSTEFDDFCAALTGDGEDELHFLPSGPLQIPISILNYAKYIKENVVSRCPGDIQECFGSDDDLAFQDDDLSQTWRLWIFQVCTQWGYFMPAPLEGPRILSKFVTLEHSSKVCKQAFPPGKYFSVPEFPDVESINALGDYGIEADRLAFIDGDRDPWRVVTPGSNLAPKRNSTLNQPQTVIYNAIHHYDENGLADHSQEPERIRSVHEFEKEFVKSWLAEFKPAKQNKQ